MNGHRLLLWKIWQSPQRLLLAIGLVLLVGFLGFWLLGRHLLTNEDETWQRIQQSGVWRVGMDPSFPPFEMLDSAGQPIGYDVDLAQAIAARWGVQAQIISLGFDGLTDALVAGKVDSVISALPHDPRLTEDLGYSTSYFEAGVRLAVAEDSPIQNAESLAGQRLAVEWGSNGDAQARRLQRAVPSIQRLTFPDPHAAVQALIHGDADAALVDGVTLRQMQGEGARVVAVGVALESTPYVIALPAGAHQMQTEINAALAEFAASNFLVELEKRWFSGTIQK